MNKTEYLLTCLAEECAEVIHRITKAQRFTLDEIQPGQDLTNGHRITQELIDLIAVMELLVEDETIENPYKFRDGMDIKKMKIYRFMDYSRERGCLHD